ncbi:hypothetical protein FB451DRAFT_1558757 [Mycena latifolia]|nr:hypothetical protein FB451DRAFT_1558757 [Mycena latifolia]
MLACTTTPRAHTMRTRSTSLLRLASSARHSRAVRDREVHMHIYQPHEEAALHIWAPTRAHTKQVARYLDNSVAGSILSEMDAFEVLVKECTAEASLSSRHLRQLTLGAARRWPLTRKTSPAGLRRGGFSRDNPAELHSPFWTATTLSARPLPFLFARRFGVLIPLRAGCAVRVRLRPFERGGGAGVCLRAGAAGAAVSRAQVDGLGRVGRGEGCRGVGVRHVCVNCNAFLLLRRRSALVALMLMEAQILAVIPVPVRWAFVGIGFGMSGYFLVRNVYPMLSTVRAPSLLSLPSSSLPACASLLFSSLVVPASVPASRPRFPYPRVYPSASLLLRSHSLPPPSLSLKIVLACGIEGPAY